MADSTRNPRGVHAESLRARARFPTLPSHPNPSQRTKTSAARFRAPVLVALTHEVLNVGTFESISDLADAVKTTAARLKIPYDGDAVAKAIRSVHARRPITTT
jgi:hypothetical protein